MRLKPSRKMMGFKSTACFLICVLLLQGCFEIKNSLTYVRKNRYPANTSIPFLYQTSIELKGGNFNTDERNSITQKLYTQLDDSARVNINDRFFIFHKVVDPPAFDTAYVNKSSLNIKNYLLHLGYNRATETVQIDTADWKNQKRVTVKYSIDAGVPTLIDTFRYLLKVPDLQNLAQLSKQKSYVVQDQPVTKLGVLSEISRLVDTFRNNGYYRFTSDELRMRGDSAIEALRNTSDDPLENLTLLALANEQRNKPTVKLAMVINPSADSSNLLKYYINNIFIYPDFAAEDASSVATFNEAKDTAGNTIRYHKNIIQTNFLSRYIYLKKGNQYSQEQYAKTVNGFAALGVWQNVNVQLKPVRDSSGLLDVFIQLVPAKKYGFEAKLEASYSANSNINSVSVANAGNLLGLSGNLSLQNRNVGKRGIKMTNAIRAGVELNLNAARRSAERINSNEFSFSNTISVPKMVPNWFLRYLKKQEFYKDANNVSQQTFFNTTYANTNRIGLFKLNSLGFNMGYEFVKKNGRILTFRPFNIEYTNLYGRTAAFDSTLKVNPFLRYSFNTALIIGAGFSYSSSHITAGNTLSTFKFNVEESGFLLPALPLGGISSLRKDLRQYVKFDLEKTLNYSYQKSSVAIRFFGGVGVPIGKSDTTLPFFKQYFAGGANSMRAWPVRGLGPGSKKLAPFDSRTFADRTGDVRLEANIEYRRTLLQIIPNSLTLKWALFADVGNIWNVRNTQPGGGFDSAQFKLNLLDFYKELGVTGGAGLRFDFNYVLLRIDLGFRFKRPELSENSGWKAPSVGFNDLYSKIFRRGEDDEFRRWRYENFNFSIGLSYPF